MGTDEIPVKYHGGKFEIKNHVNFHTRHNFALFLSFIQRISAAFSPWMCNVIHGFSQQSCTLVSFSSFFTLDV
jgi:hypothetical protein